MSLAGRDDRTEAPRRRRRHLIGAAVELALGQRHGVHMNSRIQPRRAGDSVTVVSNPALVMATGPWQPKEPDPDAIIAHVQSQERRLGKIRSAPMAETH